MVKRIKYNIEPFFDEFMKRGAWVEDNKICFRIKEGEVPEPFPEITAEIVDDSK